MAASKDSLRLLDWYLENKRELPWRKNRDPYRIWISEVMLQQTTVAAVIPFYERFLKNFPSLEKLAKAPLEKVLENWAGLGYYSRARNLHKAAQKLAQTGFPKTHTDLIKYPGFGPYTARAVTSIAFGESTGVLDGNVIRILSRKSGESVEWWKTSGRNQLQELADKMVVDTPAHETNQALMELGATICTPTSPTCFLCPWTKNCIARKAGTIDSLPLKKPKKEKEIWLWQPEWRFRGGKVFLIPNDYTPFLKGQWLPPGKARKVKKAPAKNSFRHGITHHEIHVQVQRPNSPLTSSLKKKGEWADVGQIHKWNPTSLIKKIIDDQKERRL